MYAQAEIKTIAEASQACLLLILFIYRDHLFTRYFNVYLQFATYINRFVVRHHFDSSYRMNLNGEKKASLIEIPDQYECPNGVISTKKVSA